MTSSELASPGMSKHRGATWRRMSPVMLRYSTSPISWAMPAYSKRCRNTVAPLRGGSSRPLRHATRKARAADGSATPGRGDDAPPGAEALRRWISTCWPGRLRMPARGQVLRRPSAVRCRRRPPYGPSRRRHRLDDRHRLAPRHLALHGPPARAARRRHRRDSTRDVRRGSRLREAWDPAWRPRPTR